jgi:hypothetical protein
MRTHNAIAYLTSIHGHLKELEEVLDIEIVCFEVHPEGVYINVPTYKDLIKIGLGHPDPEESVLNTTLNIDEVKYQFYTFDRKE